MVVNKYVWKVKNEVEVVVQEFGLQHGAAKPGLAVNRVVACVTLHDMCGTSGDPFMEEW